EAHGPNHWRIPSDVALPHGSDPVEELHTSWNRNEECHEREEWKQNCTGNEHVVSPDSHRQRANSKQCEDHAGVTEQWLAGEDRPRKNRDRWVSEGPEQVLPQKCSTGAGVVDVAAQLTVVENAECRSEQQWEDQQRQGSGDENAPDENWQTEHGHARCTHRQNGGHHVDSGKNGTDTGCTDTDNPHVCTDTRGVNTVSQWHVHGPAEVSCATWGQESGQHD